MAGDLLPMHKDYLLLCLVRSEQVVQRALSALDPEVFDPDTERHMAVIWVVSSEFFKTHRRLPPRNLLQAEVDSRIAGSSSWASDPLLLTRISESIEMIYAASDNDIITSVG